MKNNENELSPEQRVLPADMREELFNTLRIRFEENMGRHTCVTTNKDGVKWANVQARLDSPVGREKLWSLYEMEKTGGEPDVVGHDEKTGEVIFFDCAAESPKGRRSVCYDREALESRKAHKPGNTAMDMAADMGIELLSEEQYRQLQSCQEKGKNLDTKTSSWVKTPADIRKLGGALFCDYRYGTTFTYHNGADSYYAARGFRGALEV